jgi:hypothetical protein
MKRLLLVTPLLCVLAACGGGTGATHAALSHTTRLDDTPLRLDVEALHRVGQVAAVDLRLANRARAGTDQFSIDDTFSADGYSADVGGILLLDSRTGQPLTPLGADEADLGMTEIAPGGTQMIRAAFRAPRGDTADVFVPHFGLFRDVPVR